MTLNGSGNLSIGNINDTYKLDVSGTVRFTGQLRLQSTITDGTNTYTLPSATGTLALTSQIPSLSGYVQGSGTTNYLPKFTGASTIGNSLVYDNGTNVGIGTATSGSGRLNILNISASPFLELRSINNIYQVAKITFDESTDKMTIMNNQGYSLSGIAFGTNGTERMFLNVSGNLGLGVTPSAWDTYKAFQIGAQGSLASVSTVVNLSQNAYWSASGHTYIATGTAAQYHINDGVFAWRTAPSGTAGNAISFTQAMMLNASGNLSIGNTNDTYKLDVTGTGRFTGALTLSTFTTSGSATFGSDIFTYNNGGIFFSGGGTYTSGIFQNAGGLQLQSGGSPRLTIASTGAATFSSSVTASGDILANGSSIFTKAASGGYQISLNAQASTQKIRFDDLTGGAYGVLAFEAGNGTGGFVERMIINNGGNVLFNQWYGLTGGDMNISTNTGGTANIIFGTGAGAGTERMRITSGGNVGIGTTSPGNLLEVFAGASSKGIQVYGSSSPFVQVQATNNPVVLKMTADDVGGYMQVNTNHPLIFHTNSTERMRITSGGDISFNGGSGSGQVMTATPKNFRFNNDYSTGYTDASLKIYLFNSGSTIQGFTSGPSYDLQYHTSGSSSGRHAFYVENSEKMIIASDAVLINATSTVASAKFYVNGTGAFGSVYVGSLGTGLVYSNGGTLTSTNPSDQRLKNTIKPLSYGLNEILQLNPKTFYYNDDVNKERLKYGFIAQEVKDIMPELARKLNAETDYLGLETEGIYVTLVNAIKEQQNQINELKSQLNK
jgi:hypothetical protein